jgi:hypothetical protein
MDWIRCGSSPDERSDIRGLGPRVSLTRATGYIFSINSESTSKMWQDGDPVHLAPLPLRNRMFIKRRKHLGVIGQVKLTVLDP